MTTLKFMTVDQHLVLQRQPTVASGDKNSVLIQIQLCPMWDGFDVKVAFYKDGNRDFVLDIPLEDGACMVPPEMLDSPCVLNIGIWGKDARGRYKTSTMVKYRIAEGTPIEAGVTLVDVRDGTAEEDQVLAGSTFYAGDHEKKTGNIPTYEDGDPVYSNPYVESDPTVPDWAKAEEKPTYKWEEITEKPFTNGKLNPECLPDDIGGGGGSTQETDPTVPAWAKQPTPPAESDPTVPAWAKQDKKPAYGWDEITDKPFTNGKLNADCLPDDIGSGGGSENAVEYTEQTLTEEQKAQARANIGAAAAYTYGKSDLVDGVSYLAPGTMYFTY